MRILTHDAVAANAVHAVDTAAPTLTVATVNGNSLVLTYNEALDASSTPANDAYTIAVSDGGTAPTVTGTTISDTMATLAFERRRHTRGDGHGELHARQCNPLRDVAGNNAAMLSGAEVTNTAPVATVPVNQSYTVGSAIIPLTLETGPSNPGETTYALTGPTAVPGNDDLPAGLTFAPATRILSGTPTTVAAAVTLTYTVSDRREYRHGDL